jgi:hypothetical protein
MPKKSANPRPREIVQPPGPVDTNRRYPIKVANALLSQSNSKTYEDIAAGRLKVIKDGKRTYIPGSEIVRRSTLAAAAA